MQLICFWDCWGKLCFISYLHDSSCVYYRSWAVLHKILQKLHFLKSFYEKTSAKTTPQTQTLLQYLHLSVFWSCSFLFDVGHFFSIHLSIYFDFSRILKIFDYVNDLFQRFTIKTLVYDQCWKISLNHARSSTTAHCILIVWRNASHNGQELTWWNSMGKTYW